MTIVKIDGCNVECSWFDEADEVFKKGKFSLVELADTKRKESWTKKGLPLNQKVAPSSKCKKAWVYTMTHSHHSTP